MNNQEFSLPVYIAKGVKTSGFFWDLGPLEVAIFDSVTNAVATASGNGKQFYLGGGSIHTKDELTPFYFGMKEGRKSQPFLGKDIISFEKSYPQRPRNEEWVLGYGGGADDNSLVFECNKRYQLKIRLYGEPAFRLAGKSMEKVVSLVTPCCDVQCSDDCVDNTIDPKIQVQEWVKAINDNPDLKGWKLKAQPVFEDYQPVALNSFIYSLSVVDNGDVAAQQDVERAYPTSDITRVSYINGRSVYEIRGISSAPATFTPKVYGVLADCETCPTGYTLVTGYDQYIIHRNLNTTTDLDDDASRTTFAGTIATAYSAISGSAVYVGQSEGLAHVRISVTAGTTVNIASGTADIVEKIGSQPSICTPPAASALTWVRSGSGNISQRQLTITITGEDCEDSAITAATINAALLESTPSYVSGSATDISTSGDVCVKKYRITQNSQFLDEPKCKSPDNVYYDEITSYRGYNFIPVPPTPGSTSVKVGIRFSAPFYSPSFGDCSYDPNEYTDAIPLRMEVSVFDWEMNPCTFSKIANGRRVVSPRYEKFSGASIRREYIMQAVSTYFVYEDFAADPRSREIVDNTILSQISSSKYFVAYYLKYNEVQGLKNFNQKSQVFEPVIYVEDGDFATQTALEKALLAITAKFGVGLTKRG